MEYLSNLSDLPEFATAKLDSEQVYMPRPIFEDSQFSDLKADGKMLYTLLLNRLREPIDFVQKGYDENGNTFVHYPGFM